MGKERLDRQLSQALSTKTPRSHTSNTKQQQSQIDKRSSRSSSSKSASKAGWSKSLTISSDGSVTTRNRVLGFEIVPWRNGFLNLVCCIGN